MLEWWGRKLGFFFNGFLLPIFCGTAAAASSFVAAGVCVGFGGGVRGRGAERPCGDLLFSFANPGEKKKVGCICVSYLRDVCVLFWFT